MHTSVPHHLTTRGRPVAEPSCLNYDSIITDLKNRGNVFYKTLPSQPGLRAEYLDLEVESKTFSTYKEWTRDEADAALAEANQAGLRIDDIDDKSRWLMKLRMHMVHNLDTIKEEERLVNKKTKAIHRKRIKFDENGARPFARFDLDLLVFTDSEFGDLEQSDSDAMRTNQYL